MDKIDQLIVRACKSMNPKTRLESVYKRFYYSDVKDERILELLVNVTCRYNTITTRNLIEEAHPNNHRWAFAQIPPTYTQRMIQVLLTNIRLAPVSVFNGLTPPRS